MKEMQDEKFFLTMSGKRRPSHPVLQDKIFHMFFQASIEKG